MAATLYDYYTGARLRPATPAELAASREAARHDGGAGVISAETDADAETAAYALED